LVKENLILVKGKQKLLCQGSVFLSLF